MCRRSTCGEQAQAIAPTCLSCREWSCQRVSLSLAIPGAANFLISLPSDFSEGHSLSKGVHSSKPETPMESNLFQGWEERGRNGASPTAQHLCSFLTHPTVTGTPPLPKILYPRKRKGTEAHEDTAWKTRWSWTPASSQIQAVLNHRVRQNDAAGKQPATDCSFLILLLATIPLLQRCWHFLWCS